MFLLYNSKNKDILLRGCSFLVSRLFFFLHSLIRKSYSWF
uniref:Uncharacterized protein n=1 Tax=Listeria monocytogenes TaxID=1639 RepID=L7NZS8_LISMN|nr:hypothetical protein [Listeria monocytogenes]